MQLSAVNSINWARVMAQTVYYVTAARALAGAGTFCVPTGNFGNVLVRLDRPRDGRTDHRLHRRSNTNDILTRFINDGDMSRTPTSCRP